MANVARPPEEADSTDIPLSRDSYPCQVPLITSQPGKRLKVPGYTDTAGTRAKGVPIGAVIELRCLGRVFVNWVPQARVDANILADNEYRHRANLDFWGVVS